MKTMNRIGLAAATCICLSVVSARATTIVLSLGLNATYDIGEVFGSYSDGGEPGHDNADITHLLGMGAGTSGFFTPPSPYDNKSAWYERSSLSTAGLSLTTTSEDYNDAGAIGGLTQVTIAGEDYVQYTLPTPSNPYTFLLAKYDGKNGGGELWDIGGFAAGTTIDIPLNAGVSGSGGVTNLVDVTSGGYGMTSFVAVSGTKTTVPDGGATALLLGAVLTGIGLVRRKLS